MHRKEDELHVRYFLAKPHASIHAVEPRHRDVENDHIGPGLGGEIDKLVAIAGSADNFAPRLQQTPKSVKEHRVIVSQKQSGAAVHLEGGLCERKASGGILRPARSARALRCSCLCQHATQSKTARARTVRALSCSRGPANHWCVSP